MNVQILGSRLRAAAAWAAALVVAGLCDAAPAATSYTIKRIGVPSSSTTIDGSGGTLDSSTFLYADGSGNVVGKSNLYSTTTNDSSPSTDSSSMWFYNSNTSTNTPLGLVDSNFTGTYSAGNVYYERSTARNNLAELPGGAFGNSRIYSNGYVVGASRRFDSNGTALGADAWIFNGNGATATTASSEIPIPTSVSVPTSSAQSNNLTSLGLSGSSGGVSSNSGNLAYNVPTQNSPNAGGTLELMGNSTSTPSLQVDANGRVAGLVATYYNTTGSTWTQTATDSFYYNGTTSKIIGLVNGNNVGTTGITGNKFARVSTVTRINDADQVLGYSSYYGGATNSTATGNDIWLYDPNNLAATTTANAGNGTQLIAPPSSLASSGNVYASGNVTPTYLTNSGIVASAFQQYGSGDTARATTLSQDTFLYNSKATGADPTNPIFWTKVGLTGSAYNFVSATGNKTGVGGSSFGNTNYSYAPSVSETGQAEGFTKRTGTNTSTSAAITLGQDAWVYYPTGHVPINPVNPTDPNNPTVGTNPIGLTGGAYETLVASTSANTRVSTPAALTASGAVVGTSNRYYNSTSANSSNAPASGSTAGTDVWIYDPARGITTTKAIGLFSSTATPDPVHEFTVTGTTNIGRSSNISVIGSNGMVAGTSARYGSANYTVATGTGSPSSTGVDAWVFDPITNKTYNVEDASPNSSYDATRTNNFAASVQYISNSGVAIGYDSGSPTTLNTTGQTTPNYKMFDWYLAYDGNTGLNDIPTFNYLYSLVDPASLSAGLPSNEYWANLFAANTTNGGASLPATMTADGKIIGLGDFNQSYQSTDGDGNPITVPLNSANSIIPFQLTAVPEPASLSVLIPGLAMLISRRKRAGR